MEENWTKYPPFPEFEKFVSESNLISKATGSLSARLPRVMGQGSTKAIGLNLPPASIERMMELTEIDFPSDVKLPEPVKLEIKSVKKELENKISELTTEEGARKLCSYALSKISSTKGLKNNYFFAGRFVLIPDKKRISWSWSITPHYPIISKIPPDAEYILKAFEVADKKINDLILKPDEFLDRFKLSWIMARHFSKSEDVLVVDVARMFLISAQENKFWQNPQRKFFKDYPQAVFIANYLAWKQSGYTNDKINFELVPAVLNQAFGSEKQVFYLPMDYEGTQTRPYKYIIMLEK